MRKKTFISVLSLLSGAFLAAAQAPQGGIVRTEGSYLKPLQKRDSVLIADQLEYGFTLKDVAEDEVLSLPEVGDTLMTGVEVVSSWETDTLRVVKAKASNRKLLEIRSRLVITSFDEGEYHLPPLAVRRETPDGKADTVVFDPQVLTVTTMPVDTATFVPHDIKGQIRYPLTFKEVLPWLLGALLLAALVWLLVRYLRRRRLEKAGLVPGEPAHITALRKLDRFRGEKFWEPERQKAFYSGVTDTLREYIVARYGVGAMEMTTAEIFGELKSTDIPAELYVDMKDLFERSDMVKFAKHVASREENAAVLPSAVRFVTSTYQSEIDAEAGNDAPGTDPEPEKKAPARVEDDADYMPK